MNKVTCQTRYSRLKKIYYPGEVKSITKKKKRDVTSTAGAASDKTDATDSPETHDSDMELEDATD